MKNYKQHYKDLNNEAPYWMIKIDQIIDDAINEVKSDSFDPKKYYCSRKGN